MQVIAQRADHGRARPPYRPAGKAALAEATIDSRQAAISEVRDGLRGQLTRLWRYGLVLSGRRDTADDLVQATCLRALERAEQFQPGSRLDKWLFTILHSLWINEIRSRKIREGQGFVDAETSLVFDGSAAVETHMAAREVIRLVETLPEAQRSALFLAYVEGMAYREVAEVLEIPIGTVMSRLAAGRARIAATLGDKPVPSPREAETP
ncbi:RNA polymerase sigma factor [Radicibacter daui]|uniref:RNA polymerase sigma factor n=1 Tax=Radicibacter daui TaxID=3064829 RepID=UPI004046D650